MSVTISHAAEWDSVFGHRTFFGADRRVTSSSRLPGKAIVGVVDHSRGSKLVRCPKCGVHRHNLGGPHAPLLQRDGRRTDCVGDEVRP